MKRASLFAGFVRLLLGVLGESPTGWKESWAGHSEWRPVSYNLSLVRGYVCPEMEKGWLLGKEPIISVRARRSFSKGNNPVSRSSVSVAWLVMPVHWIRDEHTCACLQRGRRVEYKLCWHRMKWMKCWSNHTWFSEPADNFLACLTRFSKFFPAPVLILTDNRASTHFNKQPEPYSFVFILIDSSSICWFKFCFVFVLFVFFCFRLFIFVHFCLL